MIFKIDQDTRDLVIDGEDFLMTSGLEETADNVRSTLWAWKGEADFDLSHGTGYRRIFEKNVPDSVVEAVIQEAITQEPSVINILRMNVTRKGRTAIVNYTATSNNGIVESEVQV